MMTIHLAIFISFYYFLDFLRVDLYLRRSIYLFLFISLMIALLAILQYAIMKYHIFLVVERRVIPAVDRWALYKNDAWNAINGGYRSQGTFFHPNSLGAYLALGLPIFLSLFLARRSFLQRLGIVCAISVILTGVYVSGSRGALLNIAFSSLFVLIVYWKSI